MFQLTNQEVERLRSQFAISIGETRQVRRGERVLLDADLAALYGVETRRLNEQVRRNRRRFPADFIFRLTREEIDNLMSQFATSRWSGRRKLPYAFTEHGATQSQKAEGGRRKAK